MRTGLIYDTDSYKISHYKQTRPNTTSMFDYIESRGGLFPETLFYGLQYKLKTRFTGCVVTKEDVDYCNPRYTKHGLPFNAKGWTRIANEFNGKLPLRIRAVPEGMVVPTHSGFVTIESTDPETCWLPGWCETNLMRLWYPINVATLSYNIRKIIQKYWAETSNTPEQDILWKLHDFGSRGATDDITAAIGDVGHLISFRGTDTTMGLFMAEDYYGCEMAGFSIPAAEHSTITSWGKENEAKSYENMIIQFAKPGAVVAVVSDSYDIYNACENIWGGELRQKVIDSGACIVIRPDSGHPPTVVCKILEILGNKFGTTINAKGYKVLPPYIRVIQGDGINLNSIVEILEAVKNIGFSVENIGFGMGGALLQQHDRDTQKMALKCSSITVNNIEIDVFKDPVTDPGKKSKKGRLDLIRNKKGELETVRLEPGQIAHKDTVMRTVFENGELLVDETLDEIRTRAWGN
jgi:nicotinamide phosphoribosyltransferase